MKDLGGSG
jgi:thiaminase